MNNPRLLVLAVLALWSCGTLLGRLIADRAPFFLLGISFAGSALVFLPFYHAGRQAQPRPVLPIPVPRSEWLAATTGYFFYSMTLCLSFRAYGRAAEPTVLNYTWPLFTVLFSQYCFGGIRRTNPAERRIEAAGLLAGFAGVAWLALDGDPFRTNPLEPAGLLWGLAAGLCYGYYSARSALVPRERRTGFLLAGPLLSLVLIFPLAWTDRSELPALTRQDLFSALALGILVNGAGYALWTRANQLARDQALPVAQLAAPTFFLPLIALALVRLLLGEIRAASPAVTVAVLLVLAGSLLCRRPDLFVRRRQGSGLSTVDRSEQNT